MTRSEITRLPFDAETIRHWAVTDRRYVNWPVVYVLDDESGQQHSTPRRERLTDVYVGESLNAVGRMKQHLDSEEKKHLRTVRVILDETFNKSVCLDLESYLIRMLSGDGSFRILNRNDGITDADYYERERYQETFRQVFEELRRDGVFTRTIPEIENSDLFKFSPFKALSQDQAIAVEDIVEGLIEDLEDGATSTIVIEGAPGTGKTVVAVYLLKLIADIAKNDSVEDLDQDSLFSDFFVGGVPELFKGIRMGLVIPQQSLRESIKKVFRKTPGLSADMALNAFDVGLSNESFDLLIVDETHRLNQRANQPSGMQNKNFRLANERLFGADDITKTQLDWIRSRSRHQIFLVDAAQSVRPADLREELLTELIATARSSGRYYPLASQMRVQAGSDFVAYVRAVLGERRGHAETKQVEPRTFGDYDFRMFANLEDMLREIRAREDDSGLARVVAGYAWPWLSKKDKAAYDIEIDGCRLRWNSAQTDWIASPKSLEEVGSIHTVQGYDLNYAAVIIGPDLRYDPVEQRLVVNRDSYFDKKGKENNPILGLTYSDEDLLRFIRNTYAVLLTRGIKGTYVYACDAELRSHLEKYIPAAGGAESSGAGG